MGQSMTKEPALKSDDDLIGLLESGRWIVRAGPQPPAPRMSLREALQGDYDLVLSREEQAAHDYAMEHSDMQGPRCCKCWRWKVYGGLGKYLIRTRQHTGQQLVDLWNVGQGCGGATDTKMH